MHITISRLSAPRKDEHLLVLAGEKIPEQVKELSPAEKKYFDLERKNASNFIAINQFKRTLFFHFQGKKHKEEYRLIEEFRKGGAQFCSRLSGLRATEITLVGDNSAQILAFAEGIILSSYQFLKYRSNRVKEKSKLQKLNLVCKSLDAKDIEHLNIMCTAVYHARDLVNEPQSFLNATELAKQFAALGRKGGFKVQVFNKARIRQLKMGGLLAVNLGSPQPPTFTVMEWKPRKALNKAPIVLVGKGVVYDTGGMSLKPTTNSMDYMKCDMAGGAVVGAALFAAAKAKLPLHIIGLVPATDNRPDGDAYVPGDVITMMSGKTVEVLNTDAEGRLILADALHYAKRYKPELVLEFSTLTGAASAAIGPNGIVCMGDVNERQRKQLQQAGNNVYERLVEFPFWDEYDELIKSDIADIKNVGGPNAGAITAGRFLSNFTDYPYMHFDIAGPAFSKSNDSYRGKNGTGVGVRLLFEFMRKYAEK